MLKEEMEGRIIFRINLKKIFAKKFKRLIG